MIVTIDWMKKKYVFFSNLIFDNKLPELGRVKFVTDGHKERWGNCHVDGLYKRNPYFTVTLSNAYDSSEYIKEVTFLHELIHVYDIWNYPDHFLHGTFDRGRYLYEKRHGITEYRKTPDMTWLYDIHGNDIFLPFCNRCREFGYNVTEHVNPEDVKNSVLVQNLNVK